MATPTGRGECKICGKERRAVKCEGCSQIFCFDHLPVHRQQLSDELNEIETNRDIFRQTLNEQTDNPEKHSLIQQINQWEKDSIQKIIRTAKECRQLLLQHTTEDIHRIETKLADLTDQIRQIRKEDDFNEIDLSRLKQKLTQLAKELDQPSNVSIQRDSTLIKNISVALSSRKFVYHI
jgi:chromosome segregation ATPase